MKMVTFQNHPSTRKTTSLSPNATLNNFSLESRELPPRGIERKQLGSLNFTVIDTIRHDRYGMRRRPAKVKLTVHPSFEVEVARVANYARYTGKQKTTETEAYGEVRVIGTVKVGTGLTLVTLTVYGI